MKDDLRIGVCTKSMSFPYEFFTKFDVVEDLAVERDPQGAVIVRHRLTAACEINDAQARVPEAHARLDMDAPIVGAAMIEHRSHLHQTIGIDSRRF